VYRYTALGIVNLNGIRERAARGPGLFDDE
jgi:hypothetical protein